MAHERFQQHSFKSIDVWVDNGTINDCCYLPFLRLMTFFSSGIGPNHFRTYELWGWILRLVIEKPDIHYELNFHLEVCFVVVVVFHKLL